MQTLNRKQKRSTQKISTKYFHSKIVLMFLQMLNTIKLYHWKTKSFAEHKATDELYTNINKNIDLFIEIMLGKTKGRISLKKTSILLSDCSSTAGIVREIEKYIHFLNDMNNDLKLNINSDLLAIRDELLGNLNQFMYLLTFK